MALTYTEILSKINDEKLPGEEAVKLLTAYIAENPADDEALTQRGMILFSMGKRSEAINDYLAALRINPDSRAKMAIKTAYEILNFYNKDLYNP